MTISSTRSFSLKVFWGGWDTHLKLLPKILRACESGKHISAVPYAVGLLKQSHTSLWSRYPSSTGERSWSAAVWTCIPGLRTVAPPWGRTASPWPPRPMSPRPPPCLGLQRRPGRTVWCGGTQGAGTAQRSRSGGRTSGRSERSRLERRIGVSAGGKSRKKFTEDIIKQTAGVCAALRRGQRRTLRLHRFGPESMLQVLHANILTILTRVPKIKGDIIDRHSTDVAVARQRAHRTTCQHLMLIIAGCISCQILAWPESARVINDLCYLQCNTRPASTLDFKTSWNLCRQMWSAWLLYFNPTDLRKRKMAPR